MKLSPSAPAMPAGIVPARIAQAIRSSWLSMLNRLSERSAASR